ncbi:MAG TPA: hypothetical protein VJ780_01980, partial [Flavobacterium sp.]|nr:hypothetical protein [Flavobacterium sp.]
SDKINYGKHTVTFWLFGLLATTIFIVYHFYIKKKYIYKLLRKYKKRKLNKVVLYSIVALAPATMLLFAGTLTVYINGGEILGHEIKGF